MSLFALWKRRRLLPTELRDFLAPFPHSALYFERRYILETIEAAAVYTLGPRLLDVGCGIKPYERIFAPKISEHIGIDYEPTAGGSYGSGTRADLWGDSLNLPFDDGSFDTVLSTQVIEHVVDPKRAVAEIHRVLRPGGVLILSAPMTWPIHEPPHDYFRYTEFGFRSLLADQDFEVVELWKRGRSLTTLAQLFIDLFTAVPPDRTIIVRRSAALFNFVAAVTAEWLEALFPNDRLCLGCTIVARKKAGSNTEQQR